MRSVGKPCDGCPRRKLNNEIISFHFFKNKLINIMEPVIGRNVNSIMQRRRNGL